MQPFEHDTSVHRYTPGPWKDGTPTDGLTVGLQTNSKRCLGLGSKSTTLLLHWHTCRPPATCQHWHAYEHPGIYWLPLWETKLWHIEINHCQPIQSVSFGRSSRRQSFIYQRRRHKHDVWNNPRCLHKAQGCSNSNADVIMQLQQLQTNKGFTLLCSFAEKY